MARLSRFVAVAVLLGGATVSLSACTGDPAPTTSPSPSVTAVVTPTPSVSPTPTALSEEELLALIPEDARGEDFLSASNFAKFFVQEYPRVLSTGDSRVFEALADPGCTFCENALDERDEVFGAGGSVTGGEISVDDGLATGGDMGDGTWNASFDIAIAEVNYLDADGAVYKTIPPAKGRVGVLMRYDVSHWEVIDIGSTQG